VFHFTSHSRPCLKCSTKLPLTPLQSIPQATAQLKTTPVSAGRGSGGDGDAGDVSARRLDLSPVPDNSEASEGPTAKPTIIFLQKLQSGIARETFILDAYLKLIEPQSIHDYFRAFTPGQQYPLIRVNRSPDIPGATYDMLRTSLRHGLSLGSQETCPKSSDQVWSADQLSREFLNPVKEWLRLNSNEALVPFALQETVYPRIHGERSGLGFHKDPSAYHAIAVYTVLGNSDIYLKGFKVNLRVSAGPGSIYILEGEAATQCRHAVSGPLDCDMRVSLVLRFVKRDLVDMAAFESEHAERNSSEAKKSRASSK
jgi:hypothetical protein